jgi:hypothetical protein
MSHKSYIHEEAKLKEIKELQKEVEESIERLIEEFGGTNVSWRYGTVIGKGGLGGEKRMRGNFHTTKFANKRKS